jgi:putative transposase
MGAHLKEKEFPMPRRARLLLPGIPLHLIQRGNNRSACFYADEDYLFYLDHLRLQAEQHGCDIHAWCLMTNHVHLLVTPSKPESASLMMKDLGQRFVQYINRTYERSGTLWEGRFRSCLLQEEDYVFSCYRYIEMNPVRAGMVEHPAEYRWSSYGANAHGLPSEIIEPHLLYRALGETVDLRASAYRELFRYQLDPGLVDQIRSATNGNYALGNSRFTAEVEQALGRRAGRGKAGRPKRSM